MAVNKVVYDGNTLIDLTSDTVTAETLAEGETAHDASGASVTGTLTAVQYGKAQSLSDAQKAQARTNIGAAYVEDVTQLSKKVDNSMLNWCGAWDANTTYYKNDAVSYNGSSYYANIGSDPMPDGISPDDDPDSWALLAQKGEPGPAYTLTAADKEAITAAVIEGLPVYAGEVV